MKKNLLLCLIGLFCVVSNSFAHIYVMGVKVTDTNSNDVMGDGKVTYDATNKILTFDNVDYENTTTEGGDLSRPVVSVSDPDVTVDFKGHNKLTQKNYVVVSFSTQNGVITSSDGGFVDIQGASNYPAITHGTQPISFKNINMEITAAAGIRGYISGGDGTAIVTINGSNIKFSNTYASIYDIDNLILNGGSKIVDPEGAAFNAAHGQVENADKGVSKKLTIICKEYKVNIKDTPLNYFSAKDVYGDGKVVYNDNTKTMTFDNVDITVEDEGVYNIKNYEPDLTMIFKGNNVLTNTNGYGSINTGGKLTIKSEDNATVTLNGRSNYYSISSNNSNITIKDINLICNSNIRGYSGTSGNKAILTIDNANLRCERKIMQFADVVLKNGSYIADPVDAVFDKSRGNFLVGGSIVTGITIKTSSTDIHEIHIAEDRNAPAFDLTGRRVSDSYRGIVIQNGKKFIRR